MAHISGEMCSSPTCTCSSQAAREPRGAQSIACLSCGMEFALMAFITTVEPSRIVRTSILAMRPRDQRKASLGRSSLQRAPTTCTTAVTKGAKRSVGLPKPTWRRPMAEISATSFFGCWYTRCVRARISLARNLSRVFDCLKYCWPAGASSKNLANISPRMSDSSGWPSSALASRTVSRAWLAFAYRLGRPRLRSSSRATLSHIQVHTSS
mmetsp:Transcript_85738/g.243096  ORF Transcript_85738/g.243096 Transcript_85738/m.243096 type:complete len:210 (-) Transcript_85738:1063-1692(-)